MFNYSQTKFLIFVSLYVFLPVFGMEKKTSGSNISRYLLDWNEQQKNWNEQQKKDLYTKIFVTGVFAYAYNEKIKQNNGITIPEPALIKNNSEILPKVLETTKNANTYLKPTENIRKRSLKKIKPDENLGTHLSWTIQRLGESNISEENKLLELQNIEKLLKDGVSIVDINGYKESAFHCLVNDKGSKEAFETVLTTYVHPILREDEKKFQNAVVKTASLELEKKLGLPASDVRYLILSELPIDHFYNIDVDGALYREFVSAGHKKDFAYILLKDHISWLKEVLQHKAYRNTTALDYVDWYYSGPLEKAEVKAFVDGSKLDEDLDAFIKGDRSEGNLANKIYNNILKQLPK